MGCIANKAPNFTSETASEMGKRGQAARQATLKRRKEEAAREKQATLTAEPADDEARKRRVQKQIDILLTDMEQADSIVVRLKIGAALERLWKLVQPTAGSLRPSAQKGRRSTPTPQPISAPTPQHIDILPAAQNPPSQTIANQ